MWGVVALIIPGSKVQAVAASAAQPIRGYYYSMQGHAEKCVERYCELANINPSTLKVVADFSHVELVRFGAPD